LKTDFINDPVHNASLFEKGYVRIPFFEKDEVLQIREIYESEFRIKHKSDKSFHTTYETKSKELIEKVNTALQPFFLKKARLYFNNLEPISAGFLVKDSGESSECPIHQDAQFVDESKGFSISVWVPLLDCNEGNGTLQFVPFSHRTNSGIRAWPYDNLHINQYKNELLKFLQTPEIVAGDAFVFFNSTIHGSRQNQSGIQRPVAVMSFFSKGSQLCIFKQVGDQIIGYEISPTDLMAINDKLQLEEAVETVQIDVASNKPTVNMALLKKLNTPMDELGKQRFGWLKLFLNLFYK
jgi:hypothetical protein